MRAAGTAFTTATLLDAIIDAAVVDVPWREALVKNAVAVEYCVTIQRDWSFKNQVYLLATTKRSGTHAELFSYILAHQLAEADARQSFAPLSIGSYQESNRRDDPPYLPLHFRWHSADQEIDLYGQDGNFDLWIQLPLPPDLRAILTQAAFTVSTQYSDWLVRTVVRDDIEPTLRQLAALLTTP